MVNASGAGSVLLGGLRSDREGSAGTVSAIDTSGTSSVQLNLGKQALRVEELILGASGSVALGAGSTVLADLPATLGPRSLTVDGGGALAVVSANPVQVQRNGAVLGSGSLDIGADSTLRGAQLVLDTAGRLGVDQTASLSTQALALGANRLVVGPAAVADAADSAVTGGLLAAGRSAQDLVLRSYTSIDFAGRQDWAARPGGAGSAGAPTLVSNSLVLDAPLVRGVAGADGDVAVVDMAARSIVLGNTTGQAAAAGAGDGRVTLQAAPPLRYGSTGGLAIGAGSLALAFAGAELRSGGDIVLQGSGGVSAQGDLRLAAARVTATSGASQTVQASAGELRIDTLPGSRSLGERVGVGAQVTLSGATVTQAGTVDLPGGMLTLAATGTPAAGQSAVQLAAGSTTSVAGYVLPGHNGFEAHGLPGSVQVTAAAGSIAVLGQIDASAARRPDGSRGTGDAGQVALSATGAGGTLVLGGRITGQAGSGAQDKGGSLMVDVAALPSLDGLGAMAAAGGLNRELAVRVRSGDVRLDTDLRAERLTLSADAGGAAHRRRGHRRAGRPRRRGAAACRRRPGAGRRRHG